MRGEKEQLCVRRRVVIVICSYEGVFIFAEA